MRLGFGSSWHGTLGMLIAEYKSIRHSPIWQTTFSPPTGVFSIILGLAEFWSTRVCSTEQPATGIIAAHGLARLVPHHIAG
jgi:hypothetical protein